MIYKIDRGTMVLMVTASLMTDRASTLEERGWLGSDYVDGQVNDADDDWDIPDGHDG